ncbi:hypothetical protein Tco_0309701 [Tanacetum coccineum]
MLIVRLLCSDVKSNGQQTLQGGVYDSLLKLTPFYKALTSLTADVSESICKNSGLPALMFLTSIIRVIKKFVVRTTSEKEILAFLVVLVILKSSDDDQDDEQAQDDEDADKNDVNETTQNDEDDDDHDDDEKVQDDDDKEQTK